jgi:hypothetical protein
MLHCLPRVTSIVVENGNASGILLCGPDWMFCFRFCFSISKDASRVTSRNDEALITDRTTLHDRIPFLLRRRHILLSIYHRILQHFRRLYPRLTPFHNLIHL